ncbi:multidrug efflux MFS transporter LmrS [Staphylococcus aureus]|uniref:multidrug efflux MFS transporter LmrS n=1 Tax=Staphylococcus aureus TaxID=1280 RepID=UPI000E3DDCFD|nr:multidrug efflux MFS transporter LmrS [Staphylococcus aureus]GBZ37903.1 drug resistance transporter EmrB/QacA subfamily protein [Staphylococcus aureus]
MAKVELTTRRRNFIVAVMLISAFVAILNQTLLNTALPSIMRELNINESTSQWLVTGFMLVNGVMIPLTAYLMDRIKTRPLYLAAMGTFLLGSIVAALAPNFGVLMLARVIQAMGAGVLMPLMQFTLFTLFSKEHRGFAIGPTVTGLIIDQASWRVPFIIIVGIAILAFVFGLVSISSYNEVKYTKLDKRSVMYSTIGFGLMLYAFSSAGDLGFTSPIVIGALILSMVIIYLFIRRQFNITNALLNLRVFKNRTFALCTISSMIIMMSMVGPALLIPLYVQNSLSLSALLSGLVIMPGAIINGIMSVFTGKFYDKYGPRPLIYTGFTILTITTIMLCFLHTDTSYTYLIVVYAIRMFSVSLLMMPINTTGINSLRNEEISHGTAIMNFGRVMAGSLGTALMVTLMSFGAKIFLSTSPSHLTATEIKQQSIAIGVDISFAFVAVLVMAAYVIALFIREPKEIESNRRKF